MLFECFASPHEGAFVGMAEMLAYRHFGTVMRKTRDLGLSLGMPPIDLPHDALPCSLNYWRPELGLVKLALINGYTKPEDWQWLSLQAELAAYLCEAIPAVNRSILSNRPIVVAGHMIPAGEVKVETIDGTLRIASSAFAESLKLETVSRADEAPAWRCDQRSSKIEFGAAATVVTTNAGWMSIWSSGDRAEHAVLNDTTGFVNQVENAARLLERYCPEYYVWTAALLKEVALLDRPSSLGVGTSSQSFMLWPAQVHMSRASTLQTIVMLIHECSHQYFHMLMWGVPVTKAGAEPVFSVLKNCLRPLDRVLLGFHAFANVLLALDQLKGHSDVDQEELACEIANTTRLVESLEESLQQGLMNLEAAGQDLYRPLRARLVARGLLCKLITA